MTITIKNDFWYMWENKQLFKFMNEVENDKNRLK